MAAEMATLVQEVVTKLKREVRDKKPAGYKVSLEDVITLVEEVDTTRGAQSGLFYAGYLRGVAEAVQVTMTELFEEFKIK